MNLSDFEQHIYNIYLKVSRGSRGLPYKYRKDFSDIGDAESNYLKKIAIFLAKFPHIKTEDFISAPFKMYPDEKYFSLDYYITLKATKAYSLLQKRREHLDPDSADQLTNIIESLKFISLFCKDQNILIDNYIEHQSGNTPSFVLHLKEHRVNVYSLFGFSTFERKLKAIDYELLKFILGEEFLNNLSSFRMKFFASKKAKVLGELGIQKIKNKNTKNT